MLSCSSTRKSVQISSKDESFIQSNESQSAKLNKVVDTTKTDNGKITFTEIEFYPPSGDTITIPVVNVDGVNIVNVASIKNAAIKSIKQTIIETNVEQKGKSNESSETQGNQEQTMILSNEQELQESIVPVSDPYKWRYIFGIVAILAIGLLYLKRTPIFNWIRKILSNIRRII